MRFRLLLAAAFSLGVPASAAALPGPPLQEPPAALAASLNCQPGFGEAPKTPVLLVHGALGDGREWAGNYAQVLPEQGYPVCEVTVPGRDEGNLEVAVQFVVNAIRAVHARAGRQIDVIAHSAGALLSTDALRYWPDLAGDVEHFVGLAGVYGNGTDSTIALCAVACPVAARQIESGSKFLRAYAGQPLYRGPAYTTVATADDELVFPQPRAGYLAGAQNITLQSICPGHVIDHVGIVLDAVAYAIVIDALTHPGPTDPARIDRHVCSEALMPGSDPALLGVEAANAIVPIVPPFVTEDQPEPALPCYMDPTCPKPRLRPGLLLSAVRPGAQPGWVRVRGILVLPPGALDQCAGEVAIRLLHSRHLRASAASTLSYGCGFAVRIRLRPPRRAAGTRRSGLALRVVYSGDRELRSTTIARRLAA